MAGLPLEFYLMQAIGENPSDLLPNRPLEYYMERITDVLTEVGGISDEVVSLRADLSKEVLDRQEYDQGQDLKLQTLNGHYFPLDAYDFGKSLDVKTPNDDDVLLLTTYALTMTSGAFGVEDIKEDTVVKNLADGVEFVWNIYTQTWQDWGIGNIVTAGNDHLGVVEGTPDPGDGSKDGYSTVEPGGRVKTLGFVQLKGRTDSVEGGLDAESARAEGAEETIAADLSSEVSRATKAEDDESTRAAAEEAKKQDKIAARTTSAGQVLMAPTTLGGPPLTIEKNTLISTDRSTYTDYASFFVNYPSLYAFLASADAPNNALMNISSTQGTAHWQDKPWQGNGMIYTFNKNLCFAFATSSGQSVNPAVSADQGVTIGYRDVTNEKMVWTTNIAGNSMLQSDKWFTRGFPATLNEVTYFSLTELLWTRMQDTVPNLGRGFRFMNGIYYTSTAFTDLPFSISASANRYIMVVEMLDPTFGNIFMYPAQANGDAIWFGYYTCNPYNADVSTAKISWRKISLGQPFSIANHYDSSTPTVGIDIDFTEAGKSPTIMGNITLTANTTTAGMQAQASFDFYLMGHTTWTYVRQNYRPLYGTGTAFSAGYYRDADGYFHLYLNYPKATNIAVRVEVNAVIVSSSSKQTTPGYKPFMNSPPVTFPESSPYDAATDKLDMIPISPYSIDGMVPGTNSSNTVIHFAVCTTAAATAAKVAALPGFLKVVGAEVTIFFTIANTAANPTLNVNGTGASLIFYRNGAIPASFITVGTPYRFVFDGNYWQMEAGVDLLGLVATATSSVVMAPTQSGATPSSKPLSQFVQPNVPFSNAKGATAIIIENLDSDSYSQGIRLNTGGGADRWSGIVIGGRTGSKIGVDDAGYAANQSDPLTRNGTWFIDSNPNGDLSITRVAVESKAQVWGLYLTRDGEAYLGNGVAERIPTASVNLAQRIYITTDNLGIPTTALATPAANPFVTTVGSKSCCLQVDPITRICILQGYIPVNANFTGGWNITTGSFAIPVIYLPKSTMCSYIMGCGVLHRNAVSDLGGVKAYTRISFDMYMDTPTVSQTGTKLFNLRISQAGELPAGAFTEMFINMSWGF